MKWNVHFGIRLTYDVEVEANNLEEAIAKAKPEWRCADYDNMNYAGDDVDAWITDERMNEDDAD